MLEIADFVTDILSYILLRDFFKTDDRLLFLISFSITASSAINLYQSVFVHQENMKNYSSRKKRVAMGLALVACEDMIMIPANIFAIVFTPQISGDEGIEDAAFIADFAAVCLSALVGMLAFLVKMTEGLTEVFCGNKGYEGDLEMLNDFVAWERKQDYRNRCLLKKILRKCEDSEGSVQSIENSGQMREMEDLSENEVLESTENDLEQLSL